MGFNFGAVSTGKLSTCHKDLQLIFNTAIGISKVDFGISEGHRPVERQQALYAIGRTVDKHKATVTNVDGVTTKSNHNHNPSLAVDIYVWHSDDKTLVKLMYDKSHISYIAGVIDAVAASLLKQKLITHKIRWGGNWNGDGIVDYDQNFDDFPHFELIK